MLETTKNFIFVTFQKEGIHCFPGVVNRPDLKDVEFLKYPHRHIFHFKVYIEVKHNDRDVEFIVFKRFLESLYGDVLDVNNKSCEMIADDLAKEIHKKYPDRKLIIEVSEDGENGCLKAYEPKRRSNSRFIMNLNDLVLRSFPGL